MGCSPPVLGLPPSRWRGPCPSRPSRRRNLPILPATCCGGAAKTRGRSRRPAIDCPRASPPVVAEWSLLWSCARFGRAAMFQKILVPVDLADPEFVKPALNTAVELAKGSGGTIRLVNVIPMTPVMLAEYVPPDFDVQQRGSAEEALAIVAQESGLDPAKVSAVVRQGGIYHEVLEESKTFGCDIIVMSSHRPAMKTYFLGSNAGHMVRYAKCSVLVVRKPA